MTSTRGFYAFLTFAAVILVFSCEADRLPPPTGLTYKWLDPFTVNVSWLEPTGLPDNCEIEYEVQSGKDNFKTRTIWKNITRTCMAEEVGSAGCKYTVLTVSKLNDEEKSTSVSITTNTPVPRAEVVKDFKCVIYSDRMDCSWIPVNESLNLNLSYRICGHAEKDIKPLKPCDQLYSNGIRKGCYLKGDIYKEGICMFVNTEAGWSTFKPFCELPSLNISVTEEEGKLKLSWTRPEVAVACILIYEVCHRRCSQPEVCSNYTEQEKPLPFAYDKRCQYEFRSRVRTSNYCTEIQSNFTVVTYGTNKPPDGTLTAVAIVIPIILSICVILSCYCFRRHSAIICPVIPDPSAIFKEMMMNGNKELKTTREGLYTPVPESIESCKITLVPENNVLQQNS